MDSACFLLYLWLFLYGLCWEINVDTHRDCFCFDGRSIHANMQGFVFLRRRRSSKYVRNTWRDNQSSVSDAFDNRSALSTVVWQQRWIDRSWLSKITGISDLGPSWITPRLNDRFLPEKHMLRRFLESFVSHPAGCLANDDKWPLSILVFLESAREIHSSVVLTSERITDHLNIRLSSFFHVSHTHTYRWRLSLTKRNHCTRRKNETDFV